MLLQDSQPRLPDNQHAGETDYAGGSATQAVGPRAHNTKRLTEQLPRTVLRLSVGQHELRLPRCTPAPGI